MPWRWLWLEVYPSGSGYPWLDRFQPRIYLGFSGTASLWRDSARKDLPWKGHNFNWCHFDRGKQYWAWTFYGDARSFSSGFAQRLFPAGTTWLCTPDDQVHIIRAEEKTSHRTGSHRVSSKYLCSRFSYAKENGSNRVALDFWIWSASTWRLSDGRLYSENRPGLSGIQTGNEVSAEESSAHCPAYNSLLNLIKTQGVSTPFILE